MTPFRFLAEWAIRSSILIASGWLLLWLLRAKNSSTRAVAWTAILCASCVLPALTWAFPQALLVTTRTAAAGVAIQSTETPVAASEVAQVTAAPTRADTVRRSTATVSMPDSSAKASVTKPFDWPSAGMLLYWAVCLAMLVRLGAGLWVGQRLVRRSRATGEFSGGIEIRESSDLTAPLTLGILHPAIVLPADWRDWDGGKLGMVLAHERSHIQRGDPWVQLLSGIHRCLLWGSALSWLLHRWIVETAEEASDDAVLAAIDDPVPYAETLLAFMQRGSWKSGFAGVPMARHGNPEKRIRRVLNSTALSHGVTGRAVAAIVAIVSPLAYVIATAQARPQFDIADVHVNTSSQAMRGGGIRAGLYQLQSATMVDLIKTAYNVNAENVLGGPSWLELDRYDVYAKAAASTSADTAKLMLQALLADRFKLVLHRDSRALPGLALVPPKGGTPKLKRAPGSGSSDCKLAPQYSDAELRARRDALTQAGESGVVLQTFVFACQNTTMEEFAERLPSIINEPALNRVGVADQTGLSGKWDFSFKYTSKPLAGLQPDGVITVFDAVEKQLGLKLEAKKIATPVLVVDRVNRTPGANPPEVQTILLPPPPPEFEVADLKLSDPNAPESRSPGPQPGGRFEVRNFPLQFLIRMGWGVSLSDLKGAPPWLNTARIDLTAKLPSTKDTNAVTGVADIDAFVPALRALLMDRFKVVIHTEQRPVPGYALVAAKPKMRKADPSRRTKCFAGPGADGNAPRASSGPFATVVTCQNMTMAELVNQLPSPLFGGYVRNAVLVDATGLDGAYDFTLSFTPARSSPAQAVMGAVAGPPVAADPDGPTLFDALERQLGLKLEKRDIPAPVVVLDHIEEKPAEN